MRMAEVMPGDALGMLVGMRVLSLLGSFVALSGFGTLHQGGGRAISTRAGG